MALAGAVQTVAHFPQFDVATEVSTQAPLQLVSEPQSLPQLPALQTVPGPHCPVQLPQCAELEFKSTHCPSQAV